MIPYSRHSVHYFLSPCDYGTMGGRVYSSHLGKIAHEQQTETDAGLTWSSLCK